MINSKVALNSSNKIDTKFFYFSSKSRNSLVDYIIDGTAIKEAVENGKNLNERDCDLLYPACPLDKKSAMNLLNQFLPNRNQNQQQNNLNLSRP